MQTSYLDRETSDAIKGIALMFMFIHHFFTFPDWYVNGISYPELSLFARYLKEPFKICVSVFAFLTGYFYFFGRQQTYRYALRKITDILLSYWAVFLPLMLLAAALGYYRFDVSGFVRELFALERPIMIFCWYVTFYCVSMLLMPIAAKLPTNALWADAVLLLAVPVAAFAGLRGILENELMIEGSPASEILVNLRDWFPCVISGFLCAKHRVFERFLDGISGKIQSNSAKVCVWLFLICAAFLGRAICPRFTLGSIQVTGQWLELTFAMDIFYAPVFVYGVARLWQFLKGSVLSKAMGCLGRQSLLMWFLHCVFFDVYEEVTQPILYAPKNPILVLLFGLILCYIPAVFIDRLVKPVQKLKNKYL